MDRKNFTLSIIVIDSLYPEWNNRLREKLLSNIPSEISVEFIKNLSDAKGDLIAFLSSSSDPREDWISKILEPFSSDEVKIVGSKILNLQGKIVHAGIVFDKNFSPYFLYSGQNSDFYGANKRRLFNCLYYDGMVIRRDVLFEAGGFDLSNDLLTENLRLCYTLSQERGIKGLYVPEAVIESSKNTPTIHQSNLTFRFPQDDILYYQEDGINVDRRLIVRDFTLNPRPDSCPLCYSKSLKFIEGIGEYDIYKCLDCKIEFSNPMKAYNYDIVWKTSEDYRHRINQWKNSLVYHRSPDYVEGYYVLPIEIIKAISKAVKSPSILEIGFGEGLFLYDAYELGFKTYGLEASSQAIEIAKMQVPGVNVFQTVNLEIPSDWPLQYDVIAAFEVLEHLENPKTLTDFAFERLKPGGVLVLGLPNRNRVGTKFGNIGIMDNPPHHLTRWEIKTLDTLLKNYKWRSYKILGTKPHLNVIVSNEGISLPPNILITLENNRVEISSLEIIKLWKDYMEKLISYIPREYGRILQIFAQMDGESIFDLEKFFIDRLDIDL